VDVEHGGGVCHHPLSQLIELLNLSTNVTISDHGNQLLPTTPTELGFLESRLSTIAIPFFQRMISGTMDICITVGT
jgi:hypothetical protein